jgi:iron(II)-dependent oxidoreductase
MVLAIMATMADSSPGPYPPLPTRLAGALIDTPAMRTAGRELLSLALMDARNHTLHLLALCEAASPGGVLARGEIGDPLWLAGHVGWFAEFWIARNVQCHLGVQCPARPTRLGSIEPHADAWWGEAPAPQSVGRLPDAMATRAFLLEQHERTLELLEKAPEDDARLYFYRLALLHEDMRGEDMLVQAQQRGMAVPLAQPGPRRAMPPVLVPAVRWHLGAVPGGLVLDNEQWAHAVDVPEFEIDAQAVSWAQFVEFVDDGGYDRNELWHPAGWAWLQALAQQEGGRAPRYVDQIGVASGAVMQTRFGTPRRMLGGQPAMHVTWWEADAWCRWAGRRLPAEVEWEIAASTTGRRGFHWGDVWEWTGTTFRAYPGFTAGPWRTYSEPCFGSHKVLRGASFATRQRIRQPKFRNFELPQASHAFTGFRSCAA